MMSTSGPYTDDSVNKIYQSLFCDNLTLYDNSSTGDYPWYALFGESTSALGELLLNPSTDSRIKLLAAHRLRKFEIQPVSNRLLGIVLEVNLPEGLDTLAAYQNSVATYINYTGKSIFWDTNTPESEQLIAELFKLGGEIQTKLNPWTQERLNPPNKDHLRINFLTEHGLYFGQGPINMLFNDALARPALLAATNLMRFLVDNELN